MYTPIGGISGRGKAKEETCVMKKGELDTRETLLAPKVVKGRSGSLDAAEVASLAQLTVHGMAVTITH